MLNTLSILYLVLSVYYPDTLSILFYHISSLRGLTVSTCVQLVVHVSVATASVILATLERIAGQSSNQGVVVVEFASRGTVRCQNSKMSQVVF